MSKPRIAAVYTGGTLGMAVNGSGQLVPLALAELETELLALAGGFDVSVLPVISDGKTWPPIDSSGVTPAFWRALADTIESALADFDSAVVLHGTDTMAYTMSAIGFALGPLANRVVFTGSQRPLRQANSDAAANFKLALSAATEPHGLRLAFAGEVLNGMRVSKSHSHADAGFSERAGLGTRAVQQAMGTNTEFVAGILDITLTPALTSDVLLAQLATAPAAVLRLYGSGTAGLPIATIVSRARQLNPQLRAVLLVSACHNGGVEPSVYAASVVTGGIVFSGGDITPEAGVVKLMWLLADEQKRPFLGELLATSMAGE